MTTTSIVSVKPRITVIWPEKEDADEYAFDHAIVVRRCFDGVLLGQRDCEIHVPEYAFKALLSALKSAMKEAE